MKPRNACFLTYLPPKLIYRRSDTSLAFLSFCYVHCSWSQGPHKPLQRLISNITIGILEAKRFGRTWLRKWMETAAWTLKLLHQCQEIRRFELACTHNNCSISFSFLMCLSYTHIFQGVVTAIEAKHRWQTTLIPCFSPSHT